MKEPILFVVQPNDEPSSESVPVTQPTGVDCSVVLARLTRGAEAWAASSLADRAAAAAATARSVTAEAVAWTEAAVAIKSAGPEGRRSLPPELLTTLTAEELATGPIPTQRLLLLTAAAASDVATRGLPTAAASPRIVHRQPTPAGVPFAAPASLVEVDVMPVKPLHDATIFRGHSATVRCANPGSLDAFLQTWQESCQPQAAAAGVALVLGAGNVTGLSAADAICQIFECGRAVLLKLHPVQAPLAPVLERALEPLIAAGLLAVVTGGAELAAAAIAAPEVTHVHLTGGESTFRRLVDGDGSDPLVKPVSCELGNVTPWIVVPGKYSEKALAFQADQLAASIANNSSCNCIATKVILTCRQWEQRERFLGLIQKRLTSLPARPAWYPGAADLWQQATGQPPAEGCLRPTLRTGVDRAAEPHWFAREWFVPVAVEMAVEADSMEDFCVAASQFTHELPGTLAASVTLPDGMATHDRARVELMIEHLRYGVVAVNAWSALGYAVGNVPWGGFPGGTIEKPESGIGFVHNPQQLPLVHNSIVRGPLTVWPTPPWFPWHGKRARLARGVADLYGAVACGSKGYWQLAKMLPDVLGG